MNNVINARLRLVQQLGHLSGALSITVAGNEGANGLYNKLNAGFSGCVDTIKIGVENEVRRMSNWSQVFSEYLFPRRLRLRALCPTV